MVCPLLLRIFASFYQAPRPHYVRTVGWLRVIIVISSIFTTTSISSTATLEPGTPDDADAATDARVDARSHPTAPMPRRMQRPQSAPAVSPNRHIMNAGEPPAPGRVSQQDSQEFSRHVMRRRTGMVRTRARPSSAASVGVKSDARLVKQTRPESAGTGPAVRPQSSQSQVRPFTAANMMRPTRGLPGAQKWQANTATNRVFGEHTNGRASTAILVSYQGE